MLITNTVEQTVILAALRVAMDAWRLSGGDPAAEGMRVSAELLRRFGPKTKAAQLVVAPS